ncbi:probable insulin-like peptide 7 [Patiria miniata]|uniref:Uncharacterized protein n=1 Tax=Patiria miniata TaxID=46514 RepID=A0A914BCK3_PATMI|nr:probable insulin-like peptide 7 [Patiria miniata]
MDRLMGIRIKVSAAILLLLLPCLRAAAPHLPVEQWKSRSKADWVKAWNTERHVDTCNEALLPVWDIACQNDIRKISKRTDREFVKEWNAKNFLAGSRRRKRGLNEECCHEDLGCVWEEVAEYCVMHGREKHEDGSPVRRRPGRRR